MYRTNHRQTPLGLMTAMISGAQPAWSEATDSMQREAADTVRDGPAPVHHDLLAEVTAQGEETRRGWGAGRDLNLSRADTMPGLLGLDFLDC